MKRFLSCLVSLSILVVTPAPSAWAQFAQAVRGVPATSAPGAQSGALRLGSQVQIPSLGATVAPLTAGFVPSAVPSALPESMPLADVSAAPIAASVESVAVVPVADSPIVAAQGQLSETGKELAAPAAKPESTLERLFAGALGRAVLGSEPVAALAARAAVPSGLERASLRPGSSANLIPSAPNGAPSASRGSKVLGVFKALGLFALGASAAVGLQLGAVALAPALFAVVPVAAVWAVSGGVFLFPVGLYARYRLSRRDSPRLSKIKTVMDLALGAYTGALFIAAPSLAVVLGGASLLAATAPAAGFLSGLAARGNPLLDSVMIWGALGLTPLVMAAAATGGLALAPILGMMALPAMTTIAFFLGRAITAAEKGLPFSVPGSIQKIRFPSFQWVMTGVVFALLTGYSAVHANMAFFAWQFLSFRQPTAWDKAKPLWKNLLNKAANFDLLYLGLLAFTAATGFTSPLTFLVIAFSGERAAVWTEKLLTRFLPRAKPAPSTEAAPVADPLQFNKPSRWPQFHYWAKFAALLGSMVGVGVMTGITVFGLHSLMTSFIPAVVISFIPFFFAQQIIKALMKSTPAEEAQDPEFFSIMRDLRERINVDRRAKGKKEIPMPEMVIDPMPLPNAYATGRSPSKALVGVTVGIKAMTLDAENVRDGVARLVSSIPADSKAFKVFRLAVAGSVAGVSLEATPAEVQSAVLKADKTELKALGVRMLRGVLGHEFSHVMDRHMLTGSAAGAISATIAFASYGMMWAVGHAQIAVQKAFDRILGRRPETPAAASKPGAEGSGSNKTLAVDPISIGVAAKSLPALLKLFAALWVPIVVQIMQMAASRNNEGMADEDGALLSDDPQALALALGMLTTWQPKAGFKLPGAYLPRMAGLAHLMTVNPFQQAQEAGVLPKLDAATSAAVGKADDFLFNLFITHPDTMVRIQKLHDMAEALRASKQGGSSGGVKNVSAAPAGDFKVGDKVRPVDPAFLAAFGPVGEVTYVGDDGRVEVMFPSGSGGMFPKRFFEKI